MPSTSSPNRVSIRPGVAVLSVLRHLNYTPWFALAEFVDNAIQSALNYHPSLSDLADGNFHLQVDIEIDPTDGGRIVIRDNAAGIHEKDFPRAFRPAELPPDRSGLYEFGMGMKSAACWFAPTWSVRTSPLGEGTEKTIIFDISQIVQDELEELEVDIRPAQEDVHFTEIALTSLYRIPAGRTLWKIKDHLRDIYRIFSCEGFLRLRLNGEELIYEEPEILIAPYYRDENGQIIRWRKDFDFDFGIGLRAHGFAAIRKVASTSHAGFALFRRRRLIQGSGDEGYRPELIFGKPNSFIYQRLFGEIHLEGFQVSHTKDGFQWDENEEPLLEFLREELSRSEFPILQQAREHRVTRHRQDFQKGAEIATANTSEAIQEHVPPVLSELRVAPPPPSPPDDMRPATLASRRIIDVNLHGQAWRIVLELSDDPAVGDWLEVSDQITHEKTQNENDLHRVVGLRLSLIHPFMERFSGTDQDQIEPLLRIAAALGLSEVAARDSGVAMAGTIRRNVNELLRNALWRT